jgi:biopolymer transport protein ExbD
MRLQMEKCRDTSKLREVLIQADKETEFNVIKRVMFTCSRAGFTDYSVLVLGEE